MRLSSLLSFMFENRKKKDGGGVNSPDIVLFVHLTKHIIHFISVKNV